MKEEVVSCHFELDEDLHVRRRKEKDETGSSCFLFLSWHFDALPLSKVAAFKLLSSSLAVQFSLSLIFPSSSSILLLNLNCCIHSSCSLRLYSFEVTAALASDRRLSRRIQVYEDGADLLRGRGAEERRGRGGEKEREEGRGKSEREEYISPRHQPEESVVLHLPLDAGKLRPCAK